MERTDSKNESKKVILYQLLHQSSGPGALVNALCKERPILFLKGLVGASTLFQILPEGVLVAP